MKYYFLLLLFIISGCNQTIELEAGAAVEARSKPDDQIDDDNSLSGFGGGTHLGTDSSSGSLILNSTINTAHMAQSWTPKFNDIVGLWSFEGDWLDSSKNENHGTAFDNTSFAAQAKVGINSALFDGVDDYINVGNDNSLNFTGNFTISFWAKINSLSQLVYYPISKGDYDNQGWSIGVLGSFNSICSGIDGAIYFSPGDATAAACSKEAIQVGVWNHIGVTFNSGEVKIFLNGNEVGNASGVSVNFHAPFDLRFGIRPDDFGEWNGSLDEVAIWSTNLSSTEMKLIYDRQKAKVSGTFTSRVINSNSISSWNNFDVKTPLPFYKELTGDVDGDSSPDSEDNGQYFDSLGTLSDGLEGLWHFNGTLGPLADDEIVTESAGAGNDGLAKDSDAVNTISYINGVFSQAIHFNGAGDYIDVTHSNSLEMLPATNNTSVSAWVYLDSLATTQTIFNSSYGGHTWGRWGVFFDGTSKKFMTSLYARSVAYRQALSTSIVEAQTWYHVVSVFDRTNQKVKIYIDGRFEGEDIFLNTDNVEPSSANADLFGCNDKISSKAVCLKGSIDEAAIWSKALSDNEIAELYRRGANRLKYQVRTCDDSSCLGELWQGPDGTALTHFSEILNRKSAGHYNALGPVQTDSLNIYFPDFTALINQQYFQYRVIMESDNENIMCSGSACMPSVKSVTIGPMR